MTFDLHRLAILPIAVLLAGSLGCTVNPATGKRQLNLYSEQQEVAMGRQYDEQIARSIGFYEDDRLARYVETVGSELAAVSERPGLPWTFRVVDDSSVNAFALPGGFIYLTRGILSHMGSEAEMAGVLGHEIGHVTARHSVNQLSKSQLAQIGLLGAAVASPEEFRRYGDLVQAGMSVMFLKFSRDDERQADRLGFDYMEAAAYPPSAMKELFGMLGRVSEGQGGGRLPAWLSTHPHPEDREAWIEEATAGLPEGIRRASWNREPYLESLDGMVYGPDPREGFFRQGVFYHPGFEFQIDGPRGWEGINQKQAVVWRSPDQRALFGLTFAEGASVREAEERFFRQQGVRDLGRFSTGIREYRSVGRGFETVSAENPLRGAVAFLERDGRILQLIGFSRPGDWRSYDREIVRAVSSFGPLANRRYRNVEPMHLELVKIDRSMTLREFERRYPSSVSLAELALINHVDEGSELAAGQLVKRVTGFNPEDR